jgi:hypothetical protein
MSETITIERITIETPTATITYPTVRPAVADPAAVSAALHRYFEACWQDPCLRAKMERILANVKESEVAA